MSDSDSEREFSERVCLRERRVIWEKGRYVPVVLMLLAMKSEENEYVCMEEDERVQTYPCYSAAMYTPVDTCAM